MDQLTIDRLIILYEQSDENHKKEIDALFPELFKDIPYVYENQLFLREQYRNNLYQLIVQNGQFKVRNLKDNVLWDTSQKATNFCNRKNNDVRFYLDKPDLNELLKRGSASTKNIRLVSSSNITNVHEKLFNND